MKCRLSDAQGDEKDDDDDTYDDTDDDELARDKDTTKAWFECVGVTQCDSWVGVRLPAESRYDTVYGGQLELSGV